MLAHRRPNRVPTRFHGAVQHPARPALLALARTFSVVALLAAPAAASAQLPTDPAEAMQVFEGNVRKWGAGPVEYLFTREERDIWKKLDDDEERRDFIQWFWDRRDDDLRDRQHPFKEGFYTRVASANERFSGFPRGWKSDRGRVWIILGRPDGMRARGLSAVVWTYNAYGGILGSSSIMGEMQVGFVKVDIATWEIDGGVGLGAWPAYVLQGFDIINLATIENLDLEWKQ